MDFSSPSSASDSDSGTPLNKNISHLIDGLESPKASQLNTPIVNGILSSKNFFIDIHKFKFS